MEPIKGEKEAHLLIFSLTVTRGTNLVLSFFHPSTHPIYLRKGITEKSPFFPETEKRDRETDEKGQQQPVTCREDSVAA